MLSQKFPILLIIFLIFPFFVSAKTYPNGALIRVKNDPKVFIINNNKKEWIKSLAEFEAKKLSWKRVKIISLQEFDTIKENVSDLPPAKPASSPQTSPSVSAMVSPVAVPVPVKINYDLPFPEYVRADWLVSQIPANFGHLGQKITFKYSDKLADRIENFRLYEKKPGGQYFYRIAEFEQVLSTGCEDIDIDRDWMITEAGQCGYWAIQKIIPPGGREATAYAPAANYSEGEYSYYVVGVDKDGLETKPSPETKLVFLTTVGIFNPADNQPSAEAYPIFKWSVAGGWPAGAMVEYQIQISDNKNAQSSFWTKILKVPAGKSEQSFTYDGSGLNPASKYKLFIFGHYRQSESDPDYISIPLTIPEFWIKTTGQRVSFWNFLKGLVFRPW